MKAGLNRREFMRKSAAASALAVLGHSSPALAPTKRSIGIQQFMVNESMASDPAGTLSKLASMGYTELEVFGFAIANPKEFRLQVEAAGLRCFSGHFGFGFEDTGKALDKAGALGVRFAISSILPPRPLAGNGFDAIVGIVNNLTSDDFKLIAQRANEIGERARKQGLKYAYHNHNFEFSDLGEGETGYSILLKETDPVLVEFEPDVGWMAAGGVHPVKQLQEMQGRFHLVHLKDFSILNPPVTKLGTDRQQKIVDLGDGLVPLKSIVDYAGGLGIEHFIVDQDPPFRGKTALDAAQLDHAFIAGLLKK